MPIPTSLPPVAVDLASPAADGAGANLESLLIQRYSQYQADAAQMSASLSQAAAANATDPTHMLAVQRALADYQVRLGLFSAVMRKAVGTVETLVKS